MLHLTPLSRVSNEYGFSYPYVFSYDILHYSLVPNVLKQMLHFKTLLQKSHL